MTPNPTLTLADILDEARSHQRRRAPEILRANRRLFALFRRDYTKGWLRFTGTALPLEEAMRVWPDLPGEFALRPVQPND